MPSPNQLPLRTPSAPWPKPAPWLVLGYSLLGLGTLALSAWGRGLGLNLLNTLIFLHAGLLAAARSHRKPTTAWGWRTFALGLFAQACNQGWASFHMLRYGAPPSFPGWGDLFSFLSLGLVISALLVWPLASASGSERLRKGLDGLGAALTAFFVGWFFAMGPLFHLSHASSKERLVMVLLFMGNATILGICAYLGLRQVSRFRGPLGWITVGFGISILQVTLQVPLTLAGEYYLGHPLDLLVLLAAVFIMLAPQAPLSLEPEAHPGEDARDVSPAALLLPLLPATTALAFVLAALIWAPGRLDRSIIGLASTMAVLGLFRGALALRDLQRLSAALENRVLERTQALEAMQQAMLRTERMNAMAVLGAGMAHDLNNALTTVRAYAELAREKLEAGHLPEAKDLDHILAAADQSAALTRRLMSFGRAEDEPASILCLHKELTGMETILQMLIGRGTSLRLDLGEAPVLILGARAQIEQVMVNLVANAHDAMPRGGSITLRLCKETVSGQPLARVEVEDTGEGMTPEVQANLFRPFFTTKGPGRGTGLGLASVHQLMKDLGGTLAVASQPGVGTTFVLRLPQARA